MATAKALLALCVPDDAQQSALLARQQGSLTQWDNWLKPLTDGDGAGEDPAYDDDFQLMREEINKLSGTDSEKLCQLAEKILSDLIAVAGFVNRTNTAAEQLEKNCRIHHLLGQINRS